MIEHTRDFRRVLPFRPGDVDLRQESYYLLDVESNIDVCLWYFRPDFDFIGMHGNPPLGGSWAAQRARAALWWIFSNTNHQVVTATIPVEMKRAQMMACYVGFEFYAMDGPEHRCYFCTPESLKESEAPKWVN